MPVLVLDITEAVRARRRCVPATRQTSTLWVVDMNDRLKSHLGGGNWHEHPGGGVGKEILVLEGAPYVVGSDDGLWKSVGASGWQRMNLVEPK